MRNQSKIPLVERLDAHAKSCQYPPCSWTQSGAIYPDAWQKLLKWDVTEITGMDDLHHPEDVILEAEELLAECYGSKKLFSSQRNKRRKLGGYYGNFKAWGESFSAKRCA